MTPEQIKDGRETVQFEIEFCKMVHAQGKNIVVEIFEKRLNRVAEVATQALDALEACQEEAARVRREALLEVAVLYCELCKEGKPVRLIQNVAENKMAFDHELPHFMGQYCNASRIHRLIVADQHQPDQSNVE